MYFIEDNLGGQFLFALQNLLIQNTYNWNKNSNIRTAFRAKIFIAKI